MSFPNSLFVSPEWLNERVDDDGVAILDVRAGQSPAAYARAHVPNARPFSLPHCKSAAHGVAECLDDDALTRQLGDLGVDSGQTVVLYDETLTQHATQVFWALEYAGQARVLLLDGGFSAWNSAGFATEPGVPRRRAAIYPLKPRLARTVAADLPPTDGHRLLDVRGVQEFHAAHIEGASHCCWTELCADLSTLTLLSPPEIASRLEALRLEPGNDVTTYCRSGNRASFVYFVLRLMGWERARVYDGSMNDWLLRGNPVVTG